MSSQGGYTSKPSATTCVTDNPNGGHGPYPSNAPAPVTFSDNVVTTNAPGAFASHVRPHA